jgi:hypothetical protein
MPFSETWPRAGVPDQPGAWLLTAARRRLNDRARHARGHTETTLRLNAVNLWCYKRGLMTDVVSIDKVHTIVTKSGEIPNR